MWQKPNEIEMRPRILRRIFDGIDVNAAKICNIFYYFVLFCFVNL